MSVCFVNKDLNFCSTDPFGCTERFFPCVRKLISMNSFVDEKQQGQQGTAPHTCIVGPPFGSLELDCPTISLPVNLISCDLEWQRTKELYLKGSNDLNA